MGDRANVVFNTTKAASSTLKAAMDGQIVLYSHWGGHDLAPNLKQALLAAKGRWGDDSYATRICVSRIVGKSWTEETGFGLSVGELGDNEHPILVVRWKFQEVSVYRESGELLRSLSFGKFIALDNEAAREFHHGR